MILQNGNTPLFQAVTSNWLQMVSLLIENGADVNAIRVNDHCYTLQIT